MVRPTVWRPQLALIVRPPTSVSLGQKTGKPGIIHPASRGGPPAPPVFWFGPCKDIEHTSTNCLQCFLIVFLQHPRNLYIFGHKVGPKNRFLQCCFNLFFKNNRIYAFFTIKLVQNTGFCSVFNTLASQILWKHLYLQFFFHCCPFFRCRKPPKSVFRLPEPPQNDPKFHLNTLFRSNAQKSSEKMRKHQQRKGFGAKILKGPPPPS